MVGKTKIHTIYKSKDGTRLPSVTTILGVLEKPGLHYWIAEVTRQGEDWTKVRDAAGGIGTLAHYLILCHLKGDAPDTSEYSAQDIDQAETCLIKFWDWEKVHKIEPALVERPLVSALYGFGGTMDFYGAVDGQATLVDFKTGKALYDEYFAQLAAYRQLLLEAGLKTEAARILRIGRNEAEGFEDRLVGNLDKHWQLFLACLTVYNLREEK